MQKYKLLILTYLSITVSYSVLEYQVEARHSTLSLLSPLTPFSPEEMGDLIKAVEALTSTEVSYYLIQRTTSSTAYIQLLCMKICISTELHYADYFLLQFDLSNFYFRKIDRKATARGQLTA